MLVMMLEKIGFRPGIYPRQFWLIFWGMLISTIGTSMAWPFMVVYVSGKLHMPLLTVTSLITLSSVMAFISSLIGGTIMDRLGRKWVMVMSLFFNGLGYFLLSRAETYSTFAAIMALNGIVNPLYRIGADAMMADLIPPQKRPDAYSLLRMGNNLGISIGPAVGGFVTSVSYTLAFSFAALGLGLYGLLMALFSTETLPERDGIASTPTNEPLGGYGSVLTNRPFVGMVSAFAVVQICASLIWVLMAVYSKTNYGVNENQYGWIPTTNAVMVVLFQYLVTHVTKKFQPLKALAMGAFFYAGANFLVAFSSAFWGFWVSMVIMTMGELILVPTSNTFAANLAPPDQRARYMSVYALTWSIASAIGPIFGGLLSDLIDPRAVWFGGSMAGLVGLAGFLLLERSIRRQKGTNLVSHSAGKERFTEL